MLDDQIEFYVKQFHKYPNLSLINLAKKIENVSKFFLKQ